MQKVANMPFDFTGKVIAITGAASGIGFATAQLLYTSGATLSLSDARSDALLASVKRLTTSDQDDAQLKATAEDRSTLPIPTSISNASSSNSDVLYQDDKILAIAVNVASSSQVDSWISQTVSKFGRLDGAANMAGVASRAAGINAITEISDEDWAFMMDVNLNGVFYCMRAQLRAMQNCGVESGSIVNASSIYGVEGKAFSSDYSTSKHGVVGLTRSAAKEFGGKGIRVNAVAPGIIDTPMVQNLTGSFLEDHQRTMTYGQALHRMADPMEIANINAFLLGEDSSFVTGAVYMCDGGQVC